MRNPLFEYSERQNLTDIDREPGPKTENYPGDCVVDDCLIYRSGRVEKQTSPVQIAMARRITVRYCSLYDVPRAGINIGDGCWGGHVIEHCDVFDTVKETGDHGSFNSWGRDRFWGLKDVDLNTITRGDLRGLPLLDVVEPVIIRNSRWRCDHGWDIDLDDGSSHYELRNNLCLRGGIKLREGFFRVCENNIMVGNSFHPHVWYRGSEDVFRRNIVFGPYRPIRVPKPWGKECDRNLLHTPRKSDAGPATGLAKQSGLDAHSIAADALFVDPATGDYRVKDGSPALALGFDNFPMDHFGVRKPELRALARTPRLPGSDEAETPSKHGARGREMTHYWQQAVVRGIQGEEYSAYGTNKADGGVVLRRVAAKSSLARAGLKQNDLVQRLNGQPVRRVNDLLRATEAAGGEPLTVRFVRGQLPQTAQLESYVYTVSEGAANDAFTNVPLTSEALRFRSLQARPNPADEPLATLYDGKLTSNYGPVFRNGVVGGIYKVDLGAVREVVTASAWSHDQNGKRGTQHYVLFGSRSDSDPGWKVSDRKAFTPIAEVDTTGGVTGKFRATSVRGNDDKGLGSYRWLLWAVRPVTAVDENTAYQELRVSVR